MHRDQFGLEVSCASDAALQAYLDGIECSLRFDRSGIDDFKQAIELDAGFALAHAALGRQYFTHGYPIDASHHLDVAMSLTESATIREQSAVAAIVAAAQSDTNALATVRAHAAKWPNDIFVLAHLLGPFGMLAFSGQADWCAQNVALLEATRDAYPSDNWWHITTRGFLAAEAGSLSESRKLCERAWSLDENGNCAHSVAHLHFEACANDEGRAFIKKWLAQHGKQSDMRHHLTWHLALLDIENGVSADDVYASCGHELDPRAYNPTPLEALADNASIMWRFFLHGKSLPQTFCEHMLDYTVTHFPNCGFPFADLHRAMLTAVHPDNAIRDEFQQQLRTCAVDSGTRSMACVSKCADAFHAFANKDYADAAAMLEPELDDSVLFGGSNPQRQVVADTYLEACIRAGQERKARAVLQRRNLVPTPFDLSLEKRIDDASNER